MAALTSSQLVLRVRLVAGAVLALFLVAGCTSNTIRNDDGEVIAAGEWSVFDLRPGDCITYDDVLSGENLVSLVPCDEPHPLEVFAVLQSPQTTYPGAAELATFADQACLNAMPRPFEELPHGTAFSYLLPAEEVWLNDERTIPCVFIFPDENAVGSVVAGTDNRR